MLSLSCQWRRSFSTMQIFTRVRKQSTQRRNDKVTTRLLRRGLNQTFPLGMFFALMFTITAVEGKPVKEKGFQNPILFADYSDPDVIRDGDNYYLIASTFHFFPGIPILQSNDLVRWTILGHVIPRLDLNEKYSLIGGDKSGEGVRAPSIRRHAGLFYVYFPTPKKGMVF